MDPKVEQYLRKLKPSTLRESAGGMCAITAMFIFYLGWYSYPILGGEGWPQAIGVLLAYLLSSMLVFCNMWFSHELIMLAREMDSD